MGWGRDSKPFAAQDLLLLLLGNFLGASSFFPPFFLPFIHTASFSAWLAPRRRLQQFLFLFSPSYLISLSRSMAHGGGGGGFA